MSLISYLTTIEFGAGVLETLQTQLAALGISRPLLVSDRGLERTGLVLPVAAGRPCKAIELRARACLAGSKALAYCRICHPA